MDSKELQKYENGNFQCLVKKEDFAVLHPYLTIQLTVVRIDPRDVKDGGETHDISGKKIPSKSALMKLADAAGISFIESRVEKTENRWIAYVKAVRKSGDATIRCTEATYEFDLDVRGEEVRKGELNPIKAEKQILMLSKFGAQRAETGAQLRAIRALTGLKTGFTADELAKPIVLHRYIVNNQAIINDPELKQAAVNQVLSISAALFGLAPRPIITERMVNTQPMPEELPPPKPDPMAEDIAYLQNCLEKKRFHAEHIKLIQEVLDDPTPAGLITMVDRVNAYLDKTGQLKVEENDDTF